jgi:plasmid replication initiation protein
MSNAESTPDTSSKTDPKPKTESAGEEVVVKSNRLVRARVAWTKLEHRVVAMLISQLNKDDEAFEMQRVYIRDLIEHADSASRDVYDRAEEICQKLLDQKVHVRMQSDDGRRIYQGFNCMSTCRYVEGSGYIEAKFNDDMEPFLLQLRRRFTMYRLQNFMRLSSQHSMRMYELMKMREGMRYLRISVEELREMLCCEHTYERFSDFKRYVLERAREEIKETCDIYFTYKVERDGRTPVRVNFMIHEQEEETDESPTAIRSEAVENRAASKQRRPEEGGGDRAAGDGERRAPRFNLFAMVLGELTQDELSSVSTDEVEAAVGAARTAVDERDPDAPSSYRASEVVRLALRRLRGVDA